MSTSAIEIRAPENSTTNRNIYMIYFYINISENRILSIYLNKFHLFIIFYQNLILTFPCLLSFGVTLSLIFKYLYKTNSFIHVYIFSKYNIYNYFKINKSDLCVSWNIFFNIFTFGANKLTIDI